jgi:uncharacterized membrane protein
LDHTRDLLHISSLAGNPTNLATTTTALFFTRWITHLCAPTFVFLSGISVYLSFKRSGDTNDFRSFLRKRGLWLIIAELVFINFAIWFDLQFRLLILMVICAIGVGMITLSFFLKASARQTGIVAISIIFLHNLWQFVPLPTNHIAAIFSHLFFVPGFIVNSPNFQVLVSYPFIPWMAVMMAGFSMGKIFELPAAQRNKKLMQFGATAILLFIGLRFINIYGDPSPWQSQPNNLYTFLSFINVSKSPPSLQFILLFAGLALICLRYASHLPERIRNILSVYGKVPLFYYLVHFYVIRLATLIMVYAQGFTWKELLFGPFLYGRPATGSGLGLGAVYLAWICIVVLMYPLCKWYGNYKARHPEKQWLRFL